MAQLMPGQIDKEVQSNKRSRSNCAREAAVLRSLSRVLSITRRKSSGVVLSLRSPTNDPGKGGESELATAGAISKPASDQTLAARRGFPATGPGRGKYTYRLRPLAFACKAPLDCLGRLGRRVAARQRGARSGACAAGWTRPSAVRSRVGWRVRLRALLQAAGDRSLGQRRRRDAAEHRLGHLGRIDDDAR